MTGTDHPGTRHSPDDDIKHCDRLLQAAAAVTVDLMLGPIKNDLFYSLIPSSVIVCIQICSRWPQ